MPLNTIETIRKIFDVRLESCPPELIEIFTIAELLGEKIERELPESRICDPKMVTMRPEIINPDKPEIRLAKTIRGIPRFGKTHETLHLTYDALSIPMGKDDVRATRSTERIHPASRFFPEDPIENYFGGSITMVAPSVRSVFVSATDIKPDDRPLDKEIKDAAFNLLHLYRTPLDLIRTYNRRMRQLFYSTKSA